MAWLLRVVWIAAAAIASLFVARDSVNFGFFETMVTVWLIVGFGFAVVAAGWTMRRDV